MVLTESDTAAVFTCTLCVCVLLLPALSVMVALMVTVPSARPEITLAGTPTLQLPLASVLLTYCCPAMVTTRRSPATAPVAVPLIICA